MNKLQFSSGFSRAVDLARKLAGAYVVEPLPELIKFDFSAARRPTLADGRISFLGGRLLEPRQLKNMPEGLAIKFLWIDGRVPVWINLMVVSVRDGFTVVEITTSSFVTNDSSKFYHKNEGNPPFHVLCPAAPANWFSIERDSKFRPRDTDVDSKPE